MQKHSLKILIFLANFFLILLPVKIFSPEVKAILSDYNIILGAITNFLENGSFDGSNMSYPFFPIQLAAYINTLIIKFMVYFGGEQPISFEYTYFIYRTLSAFFGAMTVIVIVKFVEEFWKDRKLALLCGIIFCGTLTHVFVSKEIRGNVFGVFWGACVSLYAYRIFVENGLKNYALAGIFLGFAVASHYSMLIYGLPIFIAAVLNNHSLQKFFSSRNVFKYLFCCIASISFFLIGNWPAILNYRGLFDWHPLFLNNSTFGDMTPMCSAVGDHYPSLFWYLDYLFSSGLWYPLFVASACGIFLFLTNKEISTKSKFFLLSFPITYSLVFGIAELRTDRLSLPLVPYAVIFSGIFVKHVLGIVKSRKAKAIIMILFVAVPIVRVIAFDCALSQRSTWESAISWIKNNIPKGSGIVFTESGQLEGDNWQEFKKNYAVVHDYNYDFVTEVFEELYDRGFEYVVSGGNNFENWYPAIKDNMQDNRFYGATNRYYKTFWLKREQNGIVLKRFSHPLFDIGLFSPKRLEMSSYINFINMPSIKISQIRPFRKRNKIIYSPGMLIKMTPFAEQNNNKLVYNDILGTNLLLLPGIDRNSSIVSSYAGPYVMFPTGIFNVTFYFKVAPLTTNASLTLKISNAGGEPIMERFYAHEQLKEFEDLIGKIDMRSEHKNMTDMQIVFNIVGKGCSVFIKEIGIEKVK